MVGGGRKKRHEGRCLEVENLKKWVKDPKSEVWGRFLRIRGDVWREFRVSLVKKEATRMRHSHLNLPSEFLHAAFFASGPAFKQLCQVLQPKQASVCG